MLDAEIEQRNLYGVMVGGQRYLVKVQDERSRRLSLADRSLKRARRRAGDQGAHPWPGRQGAGEPGQAVAEGETL